MDAHHLSKRLKTVASFVTKGARLADIGSDHAYLPAYLALNKQITFAIAGEVVKGPFENAQNEILKEGLTGVVQARLKDGLAAVELTDNIDTITICGMGGPLIADILQAGKAKLQNHPRLILQPNVGEKNVRLFLDANGYTIKAEEILAEDGHTYEIIVADWTGAEPSLSELDLLFGPALRQEQNQVFKAKWTREKDKLKKVLAQMQKAKQVPTAKIKEIEAEIAQIEGVLHG